MKSDKLQNAIGMIDSDLVNRAEKFIKKRRKHIKWVMPVAAALVIVILAGVIFSGGFRGVYTDNNLKSTGENFTQPTVIPEITLAEKEGMIPAALKPYCLSAPVYPERAEHPELVYTNLIDKNDMETYSLASKAWRSDNIERFEYSGAGNNLNEFFKSTISEFFKDANDDNVVYSPLNVYMALAMVAETAEGDTRQQILDLLCAEDIDSLRTQVHDIWNYHFQDDGITTMKLANSLWLRDDMSYNEELMKTLSEYYYASSFKGEMGSVGYNEAIRAWINGETGDFLKEQISNLGLSPETVMALVSTIYFKDAWSSDFNKNNTYKETFTAPDGEKQVDFMHETVDNETYYWGDSFSSIMRGFEGGGAMYFIRPDDGVEAVDLLSDEEALSFITSDSWLWKNQSDYKVNMSIPKFDISSSMGLVEGLENLGVRDCFYPEASDFCVSSNEAQNDSIYVSDIQHSARVKIDEEGGEAAAVTITTYGATMAPPPAEEIDFVLDKPFIFVITGGDGLPLFVGVVNNP